MKDVGVVVDDDGQFVIFLTEQEPEVVFGSLNLLIKLGNFEAKLVAGEIAGAGVDY